MVVVTIITLTALNLAFLVTSATIYGLWYWRGLCGRRYRINWKIFACQFGGPCVYAVKLTAILTPFVIPIELPVCDIIFKCGMIAYTLSNWLIYVFLIFRSRLVEFGRSLSLERLEKFIMIICGIYLFVVPAVTASSVSSVEYEFTELNLTTCTFTVENYGPLLIFFFDVFLSARSAKSLAWAFPRQTKGSNFLAFAEAKRVFHYTNWLN